MKNVLIGIAALAVVGFAYWTISPFFITTEIHDELPQPIPTTTAVQTVSVVATDLHPAHGEVRFIEDGGKRYLRYENYETLNGPDLYVYLAKDLSASEYVDLGAIRGTKGDIQYEIPTDTDLAEYPYLLTWCKTFGVLFNYADMRPLFPDENMSACAQVITTARNPQTGEEKTFPTPCDVPQGWDVLQNDISTL